MLHIMDYLGDIEEYTKKIDRKLLWYDLTKEQKDSVAVTNLINVYLESRIIGAIENAFLFEFPKILNEALEEKLSEINFSINLDNLELNEAIESIVTKNIESAKEQLVREIKAQIKNELTQELPTRSETKQATQKEMDDFKTGLNKDTIFTEEKRDETIHYIFRMVAGAGGQNSALICFYCRPELAQAILQDHFHKPVVIMGAGDGVYYIEFPIDVDKERNRPVIDDESDLKKVQELFKRYNIQYLTRYKIFGVVLSSSHIPGTINSNFAADISEKYSWYYRPDLHLSFRSRWEANVARILNFLGISFEYETLRLPRYGTNEDQSTEDCEGVYIPDFVLDNNRIIEVKGKWNPSSRQKALEFIKHFTNYEYYLIDGDMYEALAVEYMEKIPEWETDGIDTKQTIIGTKERIQIVGINYKNRAENVKRLSVNQELVFERDKENKFDKNAILVKTTDGNEIGFMAADWACVYAPKIDLGMKFIAHVESIEAKKVCVFVSRSNPEEIILWDFLKQENGPED